jgi:uncharacterized membrane protein YjjB (DUF3815 family)
LTDCIREPDWPWWRQSLPWWTLFFLVPIYSACSSLSNLQYWRSLQLPVMVLFSCCAFAANRAASIILPGRTDIISAAGAFVIGLLGNLYSRVVGGTAFTSMVTGVLFLVPVSGVMLLFVLLPQRSLSVWYCSRWRRHPNLSQFSRAVFKRVFSRTQNDHCGGWCLYRPFCQPVYWYSSI